ncbi:MAG: PH domain-containing protein [Candidatus Paceibacterota bacterium]|jgi:membrane protein YdbS with pleckstrin-like domain
MISPNVPTKETEKLLSYQNTLFVILFVVTLPLNFLLFLPAIVIIVSYFVTRASYNNYSFIYNEQNIEINKGILSKSRKTIPYNTIQNVNVTSGWLMRRFGIEAVEIWTSSPAQIQIFQNRQQGYQTEHKPDGVIVLESEDAEALKNYIILHK